MIDLEPSRRFDKNTDFRPFWALKIIKTHFKRTSGGRMGIHILKHPYNLGLALLLSGQPTSGDKYFSRHEFGPFMPGRALKSPEIEVFANDSANGTVIFGFPILELV